MPQNVGSKHYDIISISVKNSSEWYHSGVRIRKSGDPILGGGQIRRIDGILGGHVDVAPLRTLWVRKSL